MKALSSIDAPETPRFTKPGHSNLDVDFGDPISFRLGKQAQKQLIPINVTIETTLSCNQKCVHCYNFDRSRPMPTHLKSKALSDQRILELLSEIREAGGFFVTFSGGEALVHPSIKAFIREARRLKLATRLKTNASLLDREWAEWLFEVGVRDVETSIYGADPETHDRFTKLPGSFEKTISAIRHCYDAGLWIEANIVLHRGNYRQLEEMDQICRKAGSLRTNFSTEMTERYDGTESSRSDHRLRKAELKELIQGPSSHRFIGLVNEGKSVQCSCAITNCGISSTGDVYPCLGAPIPCGNIKDRSFSEIWKNSRTMNWIRSLKLKDFKKCSTCEDRFFCQRSSGAVYANTGDYVGAEEWNCYEASLIRELHEREKHPFSERIRIQHSQLEAKKTPPLDTKGAPV